MTNKINNKKRSALIHDLIHADFDLTVIQSKYGLTPDALAQWIREEANHGVLVGLCTIADIQTQILLSRYRLYAAGKLYQLASQEKNDSKAEQDIARRACVDLLKADLKRADLDTEPAQHDQAPPDDGLQALYELIHGPSDEDLSDAQDPSGTEADPFDDPNDH